MKKNIAASLLILLMASFSLGGFTVAWFTSESGSIQNVFTAGTVEISEPELLTEIEPIAGTATEFTWRIDNVGSKGIYIRVHPEFLFQANETSSSSVWLRGPNETSMPSDGHYFPYTFGLNQDESDYLYTADNPLVVAMRLNGWTSDVGYAEVWNDENNIYIKYNPIDLCDLQATALYLGLEPPVNHSPGQMPFQTTSDLFSTDHVIKMDIKKPQFPADYEYISSLGTEPGTTIYIMSHSGCDIDPSLVEGQISWYYSSSDILTSWMGGGDGWYYYGTDSGPIRIASGESVNITFTIDLPAVFSGEVDLSLEAEAVQASNNAIDYIWPTNPWHP